MTSTKYDIDKIINYLSSIDVESDKNMVSETLNILLNKYKTHTNIAEILINKSTDGFITEMTGLKIKEELFLDYGNDCYAVIFLSCHFDDKVESFIYEDSANINLTHALIDIILEVELTEIAQKTAFARAYKDSSLTQGFFINDTTTIETLKIVCEIPSETIHFKGILIGQKPCDLKNAEKCSSCSKSGHCNGCGKH